MDITSFVGKLLEQDDVDALREGVKVLAQAVMETEVSGQIGAAPYERSSERIAFPTGTSASDFEDRAGHDSGPAPGPREATGRLALVEGCRPDEAPTASDPPGGLGPLGKSPSSPGCMGARRSELCTAYRPAVSGLATVRSLLTFVWSPCLSTAGLPGCAPARPIARWLPLRDIPSSANRRSLAAFRFRGVIRRSVPPPDRILAPNTLLDVAAHRGEDDRDRPRLIRATAGVPSW
jgi:hypothetical protein